MVIENQHQRPGDYDAIKDLFRPGHADFSFWAKYGFRDHRGGGRSSGRETAARVAGGAVARKILAERGIHICAYAMEIGGVRAEKIDHSVIDKNPVRCPDPQAAAIMEETILAAREAKDSVGGIVQVEIAGVKPGLGDPVFAKLDARLAGAFFSIGAVKGVEFGVGFEAARLRGSENNDPMRNGHFMANRAGGILGGISTGQAILARVAIKPTPSISSPQQTCDENGENREVAIGGRHDPCIVPRAVPVIEAMAALVLLDCILIQERLRP
jgi:chorismate synthase